MIIEKYRTVDLFCGCGGMSLGFQNAGFEIAGAFDNWKPATDVYSANNHHPVHNLDLYSERALELIEAMKPKVIVGGPPCQDFSSAGPKNASETRAGLVSRFAEIIKQVMPRYFVMENVPRLRLNPIFSQLTESLESLGYGLTMKLLDASYCGVPQVRKRLFLIGELNGPNDFLSTHIEQRLSGEQLSMRDYLGSKLDTDYYFRVPTNYTRRGVFSVDEPSATIRAVDRPIPKGYPGHANDPAPIGPKVRALTVTERSYIQTFPEDYKLSGTKTNLNQMIGNAVPVKLAELVALALKQYIQDNSAKHKK
jgi:DNA (cytosine-5)-methyltransferase 1